MVKLFREFILYGLIGLLAATLDGLVFFYLRKLGVSLYPANFTSINLGMLCSFTLNTFFNFQVSDKLLARAARFFAIGYCGLLLSTLILLGGVTLLAYPELPVKIFSIFLVAMLQFIFNKLITFRKTV